MFKLMYVPRHLRKISYQELVDEQLTLLEETEKVLAEIHELKIKSHQTQCDLLKALGNLNKCSEEDLKIMQTIALNYMKIAINKESGKYNG